MTVDSQLGSSGDRRLYIDEIPTYMLLYTYIVCYIMHTCHT